MYVVNTTHPLNCYHPLVLVLTDTTITKLSYLNWHNLLVPAKCVVPLTSKIHEVFILDLLVHA